MSPLLVLPVLLGLTADHSQEISSTQDRPFQSVFNVKEPIRIACTPQLDGKVLGEEWDWLSEDGGVRSFLQWEPDALYVAAQAPNGKDMIISLDLAGDGWLVGKDNVQIFVSESEPSTAKIMRLDATNRLGPAWVPAEVIPDTVRLAASKEGDMWTVELKLLALGIGGIAAGTEIGARIDAVAAGMSDPQPFWPRPTARLILQMEKAVGLPPGMEWRPQYKIRSVAPGDVLKVGLHFSKGATNSFQRAHLRVEGGAATEAGIFEQPFPGFDSKGNAKLEYETPIASDAQIGYRVLQARLTQGDDKVALVRTSFRIADLVIFEAGFPNDLKVTADSRIIRGHVMIRSQSLKRLEGVMSLKLPEGWTVAKGNDTRFVIYHSRGSYRVNLELIAPAGAQGLTPLRFQADIGGKLVEQIAQLAIR